jgi:hypothetical protein
MELDPFETRYSPDLADRCYEKMESEGFCCVENAISRKTLEIFRQEVKRLVGINGRRFLFLVNPYKEEGSAFRSLALSENFAHFLLYLSNRETNRNNSDFDVLNVLRVVPGDKAAGQALNFHFDHEVVTALVPIDIPEGPPEKAGHLVAIPNLRKLRKYVIFNVLEKLLLQNKLSRRIVSYFALRNGKQKYIYKLIPGNIYFFWGYRTLHANLPVDPKEVRATMLFHFGNPHKNSSIVRFMRRGHRQVDIQGNG